MSGIDLTGPETHFAFGRNWASYAENVKEAEIVESETGLRRLLADHSLQGERFLDIGSGSGLHSLAALRLGARSVRAIDIDADSVATTRALLSRFASGKDWQADLKSVFDLNADAIGKFEVVYSWGVLHHTGALERALRIAGSMVRPRGLFAFALYRRVLADFFWRHEKRWYAQASGAAQARARAAYIALLRLRVKFTGRRFVDYVAKYRGNRGMDFYHDVHDWMGGWPYESISPSEVDALMTELGFKKVRAFVSTGRFLGMHTGILGSGCDEFVYRRT